MCALLTNGLAHRKIKEESQHETSTVKKAYALKHIAPLSYLTFPFGFCCGLLLQSVFQAAPKNIYHWILISTLCLRLNSGRLNRL